MMKTKLTVWLMLANFLAGAQNIEKLKEKHVGWLSCFVVKQAGDTVYGKVKYQDDYSSTSDNFMLSAGWTLALKDESEQKYKPADIKELNLYNHTPGYRKYITIGKPGKEKLYRMIVQGACCLVYDQFTSGGNPYMGAGGGGMIMEQTSERYYFYYRGNLSVAVKETQLGSIPITVRKKCSAILKECPEIATRLEEDNVYGDDLLKIVKAFNQCLATK